MKKSQLITIIVLALISTFCISVPCYASQYQDANGEQFITKEISMESIPEEITPLYFNTLEEAEAYIAQFESSLTQAPAEQFSAENRESLLGSSSSSTLVAASSSSYGPYSITVYTETIGGTATMTVGATYFSTLPDKSGSIASINPYSSFTGLHIGTTWIQTSSGYNIYSSNKDAYIYVQGYYEYYIITPAGPIVINTSSTYIYGGVGYLIH